MVASAPAMASGIWTNGLQKISAIIWKPGYHGFYVESGTFDNPQSCPGTGSNLYLFASATEQDTVLANRLYALILSAQAQGKTLYVFVDGCLNDAPQFTGLQLNN
jgi:hypothetical protein